MPSAKHISGSLGAVKVLPDLQHMPKHSADSALFPHQLSPKPHLSYTGTTAN